MTQAPSVAPDAPQSPPPQILPPQTLPALFFDAVERYGSQVLTGWYESGRLVRMTWRESADEVRRIGTGLMRLGVQPGDRVAIISETRPEWSACDLAILAVGGVTLGVYPTSRPDEIAFILRDGGARVAIVEDLDKARLLASLADELPDLEHVKVMAPDPSASVSDARTSLEALADAERADSRDARAAFEARWRGVTADDLATLVYTSGTTGKPKGVELTHCNLVHNAVTTARLFPMGTEDVSLIYLPLAHILQRVAGYTGMVTGANGVYAESIAKLRDHFQDVRPTVLAGVPRVYEKVQARVMAKVAEANPRRQKIFAWALDVGRRVARCKRHRRLVPLSLRAQHAVADRLVLKKIRDAFGGRVRFLGSGAAPISMDTLEFFHAAGLLIVEGYGLTETAAPVTVNTLDAYRFGTVGRPVPGAEVRIAEDGEVLCRGPMVFRGYWNRPDANEEAFVADEHGVPWFATGDIGDVDADGYLRITDRKKNLIITAGGKNIAPAPIENRLRDHPLIEHTCVIGDRRPYCIALLTLDEEEALQWAQSHAPGLDDVAAIAAHPDLRSLMEAHVEASNEGLARYETIKRFAVLPRTFDVASGTLTPTMKLRRAAIAEQWAQQISDLYA